MSIHQKSIAFVAGSLCLLVIGATGAAAATLTPAPGGTDCNISQLTTSTDCEGAFAGNNSNQNLNGLFGENWGSEFLKIDTPNNWNGSQLQKTAQGITLKISGSSTSGIWSVDTWNGFTKIMAVLKGGPSFSAYLLDLTSKSGTWNTLGIETGGNNPKPGPGLSHFSFYGLKGDTPPPSEIPLPAAAWLMLAGLGGLGALKLRKKA